MHRLLPKTLLTLALLTGAGLIVAVSSADTILHEFFVIPAEDRSFGPGDDTAGGLSGADNPEGLSNNQRDASLPPPLSIENRGDELEMGPGGQPRAPNGESVPEHNGPFATEDLARPDRKTTIDQSLSYFSVFNPSVVPWKRTASRDEVHADYSLGVRDKRTQLLKVKDKPVRPGHERFWGSVLVNMVPGKKIALPSVSPNADILRYQTEPRVFLNFHRDMADNFFVSGKHKGTVRINFLMEADQRYFGGAIDQELQITDLSRRQRPKIPPSLKPAAQEVLDAIGVDRNASFKTQLETLVSYFRAFEAKDYPTDQISQDIYKDLALSQLGVCRHRAFAFVVTAQAAGILARYIHNEAHAFVEVFVPKRGWLRIDLGGAATDFDVHNSSDKQLHNPSQQDSLPKPEGFADSYSNSLGQGQNQADVDGDGQVDDPIDGAPTNTASPDPNAPVQGDQDGATEEEIPGEPANPEEAALQETPPGEEPLEETTPLTFPDTPQDAQVQTPVRRPTTMRLMSVVASRRDADSVRQAFRGDTLTMRGVLRTTDEETALKGQTVRAYLVPKGEYQPESFQLLGEAITDRRGEVAIEVRIPETVALGPWSVYLYFGGAEGFEKSYSK